MGIDGMNSADIFDEYFDDENPKYIIKNSEIEKMYENVGIKKVRQTNIAGGDYPIAVGFEDYPPFTAEKQIAILKLLAQQCDLTISHFTEWEFIHYDGQETLEITGKDFTETFAKLINSYWQDLTDQERTEIADILKGFNPLK